MLGCLGQVQEAMNEHWGGRDDSIYSLISLIDLCPKECLKISRDFVENKNPAVSYRDDNHSYDRGNQFAFNTIGKYGDRSDLDRLKAVSNKHEWSYLAVKTIKLLDR